MNVYDATVERPVTTVEGGVYRPFQAVEEVGGMMSSLSAAPVMSSNLDMSMVNDPYAMTTSTVMPSMPSMSSSNGGLTLSLSSKPVSDYSIQNNGREVYCGDIERYRELLASYESFYCSEIQRLSQENTQLRQYVTALENEIVRLGASRGS